jgi:hypothetical protein
VLTSPKNYDIIITVEGRGENMVVREALTEDEMEEMRHYNCGGFALNTKDWYLPGDTDLDCCYNCEDWDECEYDCEAVYESLVRKTDEAVTHMLVEFPSLRIIHNENELKDFETLVLFRMGPTDFHYVKKDKKGRYLHKMGWECVIREMSEEEVYSDNWCGGKYDGPLVMFGYDERIRLRNAV